MAGNYDRPEDMGNVIRFSESRKRSSSGRRKEKRERREAETARRIDEVPALATQLERARLLPADRAVFAANLGAMCEDAFGESRSAQKAGIRALFIDTFGNSNGEASSALKKRKRYIRLPREAEPARSGKGGYGQYHAHGNEFLRLARALVRFDRRLNENRAILRLVKGSSYDSSNVAWGRHLEKQAVEIETLLSRVLQKLKPELTRLHEAVLAKDACDDFLISDPQGAEAEDFSTYLPSIVIGEVKQKVAPFLCVPLDLEFTDIAPKVEEWLTNRDFDEDRIWFRDIDPAKTCDLRATIRETMNRDSVSMHAVKAMVVELKKNQIALELLGNLFAIVPSALTDDELRNEILDKVGRERIWLYKRIQSCRAEWLETKGPFARLNAEYIYNQLVAELGSPARAQQALITMDARRAAASSSAEAKLSPEDLIADLVKLLAKQKPDIFLQEAAEFDLNNQPCSAWLTRPVILTPRLNRLTAEWMLCAGPVPLNYGEHCAPEDVAWGEVLKEDYFQSLESLNAFVLGQSLLDAEIEIPDEKIAMAISANASGNLFLVFYAKPEPDGPEIYPAYLRFPWGDDNRDDELLPATGTQDGLEILLRDARKVREGVYQNELSGKTPTDGAKGLPARSLASDIVADLACGDPSQRDGGSKLVSDLREKILEAALYVEGLVAEDHAPYDECLQWLEVPSDGN